MYKKGFHCKGKWEHKICPNGPYKFKGILYPTKTPSVET